MTPLVVRADTPAGFAQSEPWAPTLDGVLAAAEMRLRLGDRYYSARPADLAPVEGLPLGVERQGDLWWYQAGAPEIVGGAGVDLRMFHRRFDDQHERRLEAGVKKVMTAAGPYKTTRLATRRVVCRAVEWRAIGAAEEIEALLATVDQIGGKRGAGYGVVSRWTVREGGPADAERARFGRPLPVAFAAAHGVTGPEVPLGIVPPARLAPVPCVVPRAIHVRA
jgi:CRISPR type IV-associated protein Csf3